MGELAWPLLALAIWGIFVGDILPPRKNRVASGIWGVCAFVLTAVFAIAALPSSISGNIKVALLALALAFAFAWGRASLRESRELRSILHGPFRSDLKMRARKTATNLDNLLAENELLSGFALYHQPVGSINVPTKYQDEQGEIIRLFEDFLICGIESPEARKLANIKWLDNDGIKKIAESLWKMAGQL